ncbi:alpha/beta hydrolase [Lacinutrix sp. Bg11-31]|uniref:alpha/beta hydrolase n=1 Tax=Lacinutrix sp. Bg11-31 TaxID=2057808 RepID=UPI000C317A22|nr:alpha/beta hydrolase-fold protein [Lacinutrix sp. Bg11-31]AUC83118.1 esterase [Lacinutrix sp. Bg11-31]
MKRILYLLVIFFSAQFIAAQVTYKNFNSEKLGEAREIKIQLPRSYDSGDKSYPIIVVLDGDYMFEIVAGNVEYAAYWEDIPEAIVVGINQFDKRESDTMYSEQNSLPVENGEAFFDFIGQELIPYIEKTYRTEKFKVAVGHGITANFINYYLFKEIPLFNAYISLSPELAPDMQTFLTERLPNISTKTFYYLATSNNDIKGVKTKTEALNTAIKGIENKNVLSTFDNFDGPTHYSLPAHAIPKALESIFFVFKPISMEEYKETILKLETSPVDYLTEKYETIQDLFGIKKPILVNDFRAIAAAIKKSKKFEYFEPLGKLARKQYPNTLLGNYYLGRFYEETGNTKKAMKTYQSAYILEEIGGITKDHVLELSDQIKADFGY